MLLSGVSLVAPEFDGSDDPELNSVNDTSGSRAEDVTWQLVFVDPAVEDYASLVYGIMASAADNEAPDTIEFREVFILDPARDGVEQMTEVLSEFANVSAIHILSHGSSGALQLGGSTLDRSNLQEYGQKLGSWRNSLTTGADILLYGCNVADGAWGVNFVEDFAAATGADIAASDDLTGSLAQGGDWTFEVTSGPDVQPGLTARITAATELTVFTTGDISLGSLRPDYLSDLGFTSLIIEGNDATDDTLIVDLSEGDIPLDVTFHGGVGGYDTLVARGVNGGNYTPGKVFGDGVFTSGSTRIEFTGLEPVIVDGTGLSDTFTFTAPDTGGGNDLITIDSPAPGQNRVSGTSGGVAFESITFSNIPHFIIDTAANDLVGSSNDRVELVSPLEALGLQELSINTGDGDDLVDFSSGSSAGILSISVGGGTGFDQVRSFPNDTLWSHTGLGQGRVGIVSLSGMEVLVGSNGVPNFLDSVPAATATVTGLPKWQSLGGSTTTLNPDEPTLSSPGVVPGQSVEQGPALTRAGQVEGMEAQGNPVAGAISAIAVHPTNPEILYLGSPNGGIWKTENAVSGVKQVDERSYTDALRDPAPDVKSAGTQLAATTSAGSLPEGVYRYKVTFVNGTKGTESNASEPLTIEVTGGMHDVNLTKIPLGPAGTTARKIYRTPAGGSLYGFIQSIDDNTSTTFTDSFPDPEILPRHPSSRLPAPNVNGASAVPAEAVSEAPVASFKAGDTYQYKVSFVISGNETPASDAFGLANPLVAGQAEVLLKDLPLGPTGTTARRLYRTDSTGNASSFKLVTTISNNVVTTFADSVADSDRSTPLPTTGLTGTKPEVRPVRRERETGGSIAAGDYSYEITFVDSAGNETASSVFFTGTLTDSDIQSGMKSIKLSRIPLGPTGVTVGTETLHVVKRKIYRSSADGKSGGGLALVGTLDNNIDTEFIDRIADQLHVVTTKEVPFPHWEATTDSLPGLSITSLVFDHADPTYQTLYAGTGKVSSSHAGTPGVGVYKTTDGGKSWKVLGATDAVIKDLKVTSVIQTLISEAGVSPTPLPAEIAAPADAGGVTFAKGTVAPTATDGLTLGGTYKYVITKVVGGNETAVSGLTVSLDSTSSENQITLSNIPSDAAADAWKIYRSAANGDSLYLVREFNQTAPHDTFTDIKDIQNVLFASTIQTGTRGGLYRSTNGGTTWEQLSDAATSHGLPLGSITDVKAVPNPSTPGHVVLFAAHKGASGDFAGAGLYKSNDGGETWTNTTTNVPDPPTGPTAIYNFQAATAERIFLSAQTTGTGATASSTVYAAVITPKPGGNTLSRVFRTTVSPTATGDSWTFVVDTPGSVDVLDGQSKFTDLFPGGQGNLHFSFLVDPQDPNSVYFGGDAQYATGDAGEVHSSDYVARLFKLDATTPATKADIDAGKSRGEQLVSDGAIRGAGPNVKGTNPTTATPDATAGGLSAGQYRYRFAYVDSTGVESNLSESVGPVTAIDSQSVMLSRLPVDSTGKLAINVYRTQANGNVYYFVAHLTNPSLVDYLDSKADANLTLPHARTAPNAAGIQFDPASRTGAADTGIVVTANTDFEYKVMFYSREIGLQTKPDGTLAGFYQNVFSEASASTSATPLTSANNTIRIKNLPIGPAGTFGRVLFRRVANTGQFKHVAYVADNTSTTFADNTPDSSLGRALATASGPDVSGVPAAVVSGTATTRSGVYQYRITTVSATGEESLPSDPIGVTLPLSKNQIALDLSSIPLPAGTKLFVYRSSTNGVRKFTKFTELLAVNASRTVSDALAADNPFDWFDLRLPRPNPGTAPHGDSRAMTFDQTGQYLLEADDGGLNRLINPRGRASERYWVSLNGNLSVTEVGQVAYDPLNEVVTIGTQDTGSQEQSGPGDNQWNTIHGGDGNAQATQVIGNSVYRYSISNNLSLVHLREFDSAGSLVAHSGPKLNHIEAIDKPSGFVHVQLVVNTVDPTQLMVGYKNLYKSGDRLETLQKVGDTGTGVTANTPTVTALVYGGRNADGTLNKDVIYRARGNEIRVRSGSNNATDWGAAQTVGTDAITDIVVDPTNWKTAFAVGGDRVWATLDGGANWVDITGASTGAGALKQQDLAAAEFIPADQPDFQITLKDGSKFSVSLRGARNLSDVITWIQNQSRLTASAAPRVTVALNSGRLILTDTATGAGNLRIEALKDKDGAFSPAALDLGLVSDLAVARTSTGALTGNLIADGIADSALQSRPLHEVKLKTTNRTGVRRSTANVDVLLVGGSGGVFRTFNPVGDPALLGQYPRLISTSTVTLPGKNNDLRFQARDLGTDLDEFTLKFTAASALSAIWDAATRTLELKVEPSITTANDILTLLNGPETGAMNNSTKDARKALRASLTEKDNLATLGVPGSGVIQAHDESVQSFYSTLTLPGDNNDVWILNRHVGSARPNLPGNFKTEFVDRGAATGNSVKWDSTSNTLTFKVEPGVTTMNDAVNLLNWYSPITNATWASNVATITADNSTFRFKVGDMVAIQGVDVPEYNGDVVITTASITEFTYALPLAGDPGAGTTGLATTFAPDADTASARVVFEAQLRRNDANPADNTASGTGTILSIPNPITGVAQASGQLASALATLPGDNNDLRFEATSSGANKNDVAVNFVNRGGTGAPTVTWDPFNQSLTFDVRPTTTANQILNLLNAPNVDGLKLTADATAGSLAAGEYRYQVSFFDAAGFESGLSASRSITVSAANQRVTLDNIPLGPEGTALRKIYRADPGSDAFSLIATLEHVSSPTSAAFTDTGVSVAATGRPAQADASSMTLTAGGLDGGLLAGSYTYHVTFVDSQGRESDVSATKSITLTATSRSVVLASIPVSAGLTRRIYRQSPGETVARLVGTLNDDTTTTFTDRDPLQAADALTQAARAAFDAALTNNDRNTASGEAGSGTIGFVAPPLNNGVTVLTTSTAMFPLNGGGTLDISAVRGGSDWNDTVIEFFRSGGTDSVTYDSVRGENGVIVVSVADGATAQEIRDLVNNSVAAPYFQASVANSGDLGKTLEVFKPPVLSGGVTNTTKGSISVAGITFEEKNANQNPQSIQIVFTPAGGVNPVVTISNTRVSIKFNRLRFNTVGELLVALNANARLKALFTMTLAVPASTAVPTSEIRATLVPSNGNGVRATASIALPGGNNDLIVTANEQKLGAAYNDAKIVFSNTGTVTDPSKVIVTWDSVARTLTFDVAATTTAAQVVDAIANPSTTLAKAAAALFSVALDTSETGGNNGSGSITLNSFSTVGGTDSVTNPAAVAASTVVPVPGDNNDLKVEARTKGADFNGAISFINSGRSTKAGEVFVAWNSGNRVLTFDINKTTTAQHVVDAMTAGTAFADKQNAAALALFEVTLDKSVETENTGAGNFEQVAVGVVTAGGSNALRWTEYGDALPNALVTDLHFVPPKHEAGKLVSGSDVLLIGLRGRGVFKLDDAQSDLLTPSVLEVTARATGSTILLRLDPNQPSALEQRLEVLVDGVRLDDRTFPLAALEQIKINGQAGHDVLLIDARLRLTDGIFFDGGAGHNEIILLGQSGDSLISVAPLVDANTGAALQRSGQMQIGGSVAASDPALRVTFSNLDALQANTGDSDDAKLKKALVGLQGLKDTRELTTAFQSRLGPLPVVGHSVTRVLDASTAAPLPAPGNPEDPRLFRTDLLVGALGPDEQGGGFSSIFERLFALGDLGLDGEGFSAPLSLEDLAQRLDALDDNVGNVILTELGDTFTIDMTIDRNFEATMDVALDALGGTLALRGNLDLSADVVAHVVFGVDEDGFFIQETADGDHAVVVRNLHLMGDLSIGGGAGLVTLDVTNAELGLDPSVELVLGLNEPGADPFTGETDGKIRLYELSAPTLDMFDVEIAGNHSDAIDDLTFSVDVTVDSVFGTTPTKNFSFAWNDITDLTSLSISGTGVTYVRQRIHDLSVGLKDGLSNLEKQAEMLSAEINGNPALNVELPVINRSLASVLDVGDEIETVLNAGRVVSDYLSRVDSTVHQLAISHDSGVYILSDGTDYATLPFDATAGQILAALESFASIETGSLRVTGRDGYFQIESASPLATLPALQVLVETEATLEGDLLTVTGTSGAYVLAVGTDYATLPWNASAEASIAGDVLTVTGMSGSYVLSDGTDFVAVPWDADADYVRFALEKLASIGAGNVSVTGTDGSFQIAAQGGLGGLPALSVATTANLIQASLEEFAGIGAGNVTVTEVAGSFQITFSGPAVGTTLTLVEDAGASLMLDAFSSTDDLRIAATSGSYVLSDGTDLVALPWNADQDQIQAALENFASIGAGNITVVGSGGTFQIVSQADLVTLPPLEVLSLAKISDEITLAPGGAVSSQTLTITGASGAYVLKAGTDRVGLAWNADAAQIQAALETFANIEPGDVTVTGTAGNFQIVFADSFTTPPDLQLETDALANIKLDVISIDFEFPTVQEIVDLLNEKLNDELSERLAGTPVTIQGGLDLDEKVLKFDIQAELSAEVTAPIDLGSGFTDLGLTLTGNADVDLSVGLNLDFTLGLDLANMATSTPLNIVRPTADDFFVEFHEVQATGSVQVYDLDLAVGAASGNTAAGLAIEDGRISLDAAVDVEFNDADGDGKIRYSDLNTIVSNITFTPSAVFEMELPIQGMLTTPNVEMDGLLTITVPPYDLFASSPRSFKLVPSDAAVTLNVSQELASVDFDSTVVASLDSSNLLKVTGTSGQYFVSDGSAVVALAFDATEDDIRGALESLPGIGSGNVAVSEVIGVPGNFQIDAAGGLTELPTLTVSSGHRLTVNGDSGAYVLSDGTDFAALSHDANAAQIQAALEAFPSIGAGKVTVTDDAGTFQIAPADDLNTLPVLELVSTKANATVAENLLTVTGKGGVYVLTVLTNDVVTGYAALPYDATKSQIAAALLAVGGGSTVEKLSSPPAFDLTLSGSLTIADYFHASGDFAFSSARSDLIRSDGTLFKDASYQVVSGMGIDIFAGNAPGADPTAPGAIGLSLEDIDFTLVLFTDRTLATPVSYTALTTQGGSASFIGLPDLQMDITDFEASLNQTSDALNPNRVLDFSSMGSVSGISVTPIVGPAIEFEGEKGSKLNVSGHAAIRLFDYVTATASFDMSRQIIDVDLDGNGTLETASDLKDATLLTFELNNVNAFVGIGNPDTNDDGVFDQVDLSAISQDPTVTGATGFAATDGSLGLAILMANPDRLADDSRSYLAMTSELGMASLVGLPSEIEISGSDIMVEINRASGTLGVAPGTSATPLDWTKALDLDNNAAFEDTLTFFPEAANEADITFVSGFTRAAGKLNLKAFDVLEANAAFEMKRQTVDVDYDADDVIDLDDAQLLLLDLSLSDPDGAGSGRGLYVGVPGGAGFGVDSGNLTYALVRANADAAKSPTGFDRSYSAILAGINHAELSGLPDGMQIEATRLNFAQNTSSGSVASPGPGALDWNTMLDLQPGDSTFAADAVSVGGRDITLETERLEIGGELTMDIQGYALVSGAFEFTQTMDQTITDGTSLTATPLTGVTVQTISLNDVNLFVGVNGAFSETKRIIFTGSGTEPVLSQTESAAPTLVDGTLTPGNFTLSDGGTTTADIPWAVSARDIQTALNAASAFGADQFSVADGQQPGS
ncbi:MAG: DUF4347 domain-containing protein, partial [Planctomycetota bacterium]|nr:DUF4347 domain-containing protein [Planctomycetota bacterium]